MKTFSKSLVQKAGCVGCEHARRVEYNDRGEIRKVVKETCRHGGLVAVEAGPHADYGCYKKY